MHNHSTRSYLTNVITKHKQIRQQGLNYSKDKQMSENTLHVRGNLQCESGTFLNVDTLLFHFVLILHYSYICD